MNLQSIEDNKLIENLTSNKNFLIIQDIDGVCVPLVKDPLNRSIDIEYVKAAEKLHGCFYVLTNGEHEGKRGLNRLVEESLKIKSLNKDSKINSYLPGLAAGGIQFQDRYGKITNDGVNENEIIFLKTIPILIRDKLSKELTKVTDNLSKNQLIYYVNKSILDTDLSPTINLNSLFNLFKKDYNKQIEIQKIADNIMTEILEMAKEANLINSFYLHKAPNLGSKDGKELMKYSNRHDIGTTDIQFLLTGAKKEAGLLVLINKYIKEREGFYPFGKEFNARVAPDNIEDLLLLCKNKIEKKYMPLIIGVGDTVTSNKVPGKDVWRRGGSDRGFLTLVQELGKEFQENNQVILVDSSGGEVYRPSLKNGSLEGISDPQDSLKFNKLISGGPKSYIEWFKQLAEAANFK